MLATPRDSASHSKTELLSPAGDLEAGYAALHFRADAIYLGLRQFSARAEASNFSPEELGEITAYAHSLSPQRRIFVTINTLLLNGELRGLIETLDTVADSGVDAVIVQDLGVARIARDHFPALALHGSTQMAIHNLQGAKALRELGFRRVTLARELTVDEIRDIVSESGIEVEVFIHGALCYSYSGLCLFSSQMRQRSGNRGRCAYPCRDRFEIKGHLCSNGAGIEDEGRERGRLMFPFSMKDLALPEHVEILRDAGVASLKIEGRMKNPLYVAATTRLYRGILDGTLGKTERAEIEEDIRTIFSRPWTKLYAVSSGNRDVVDSETVGHRGACIGRLDAVAKGAKGEPDRIRFKTSRAIERHDGIQIDIPGQGRPYGFAVENLVCETAGRKRAVFEAPAGTVVEVELPVDYPAIPVNAALYCSSSQAVKRRYKYARPKPGEFKVRKTMDISATLAPDKLTITAFVMPDAVLGRQPKAPLRGAATFQNPFADAAVGQRATPCNFPTRARHISPELSESPGKIVREFDGKFEQSRNPNAMEEAFRSAFLKLGDTHLELGKCELNNPNGLFVPVSRLNLSRREICKHVEERIETERLQRVSSTAREYDVPRKAHKVQPGDELVWSIKTDRVSHLSAFGSDDWHGISEVIVDISIEPTDSLLAELEILQENIERKRIRLALPIITRRWEVVDVQARVKRLLADGWRKWEAGNLSAWCFLSPDAGIDLTTDWSVYVLNRSAALELRRLRADRFVLSPEDGLENMSSLALEFGEKATAIVYQDTPLFISESCPTFNVGRCKGKNENCAEVMRLASSGGEEVCVVNRGCRAITIGAKPLCIVGQLKRLAEAGIRSVRADFVWRGYRPGEVVEIWRLLRQGLEVRGTRKGNILRGLA